MGRDRSTMRQLTFERTLKMLETEANRGDAEQYKKYRTLVTQHLDKLDERMRANAVPNVPSKTERKPTVKIKVTAEESKAAATGSTKSSAKRDTKSKSGGVRKKSDGVGAE